MSGSYLDAADDRHGPEDPLRPVWEDEPDETVLAPVAARPRVAERPSDPLAVWPPQAPPPLLVPLCDAQDALARLDARAAAAPAPVRDGLNARIALAEAAGWLAFAHAWADPRDLALQDLGLTGSYAIATRVGRPVRDMPNTFARDRARAWDAPDIDGLLAGETAVATALTLARVLQRLARTGENPFASFAAASATLGQVAPEPLDGSRFAAWRSEHQDKTGMAGETGAAGAERAKVPAASAAGMPAKGGEGGRKPDWPPLLLAARAAEGWMEAGIAEIPTALQALLAAAGMLVGSGTVRAVIPPLWSAYPALGRPGHDGAGLPALRGDGAGVLPATAPAWPIAFLVLLAEGARASIRELDGLLGVAERGRGLTTGRDRRCQLPQALESVLRNPVLTPKALAAELAIAPQTATALLRELRAAGLVAEITGRRSFRAFAIAQ